jgi:hypothetical protein
MDEENITCVIGTLIARLVPNINTPSRLCDTPCASVIDDDDVDDDDGGGGADDNDEEDWEDLDSVGVDMAEDDKG